MYDTTSQDIIKKVEQVLHDYGLELSKLAYLSTDGSANMDGRHNGAAAMLKKNLFIKCIQNHHFH
jgi:hypothetical protein